MTTAVLPAVNVVRAGPPSATTSTVLCGVLDRFSQKWCAPVVFSDPSETIVIYMMFSHLLKAKVIVNSYIKSHQ